MKLAEVFEKVTKGRAVIRGPSSGKLRGFDDGGDFAIIVNGNIIGEAFRRLDKNIYAEAEANGILFKLAVNHFEAAIKALKASEAEYENLEDRAPVSSGCIECTAGTVPDKYNKGLCAHHLRRAVLAAIGKDAES